MNRPSTPTTTPWRKGRYPGEPGSRGRLASSAACHPAHYHRRTRLRRRRHRPVSVHHRCVVDRCVIAASTMATMSGIRNGKRKVRRCCVRVARSADRSVILPLHLGHSPRHVVVSILPRDPIRGTCSDRGSAGGYVPVNSAASSWRAEREATLNRIRK